MHKLLALSLLDLAVAAGAIMSTLSPRLAHACGTACN